MMTTASDPNRSLWVLMGVGVLIGLLAGATLLFFTPTVSGPSLAGAASTPQTPAPAPVVGAPAPDFVLTDMRGQTVRLSALKERMVLLNFWATWCGPCEAEMPSLEDRYKTLSGSGLLVLGINADDEPDTLIQPFIERLGVTFPILRDPGLTVSDLYRVRGLPTSFFIDTQGMIRVQHAGYLSDGQLDRYLTELGLPSQ